MVIEHAWMDYLGPTPSKKSSAASPPSRAIDVSSWIWSTYLGDWNRNYGIRKYALVARVTFGPPLPGTIHLVSPRNENKKSDGWMVAWSCLLGFSELFLV